MTTNPADVEMNDLLDSLERKIFLVRNEYQQYFLGTLRKEPSDKREEVETIFRQLSRQRINNTAANFRYHQLKARFGSLTLQWARTIKQIEDGTYRRDQFRLKLRLRDEEERSTASQERDEESSKSADSRRTESIVQSRADTVSDPESLRHIFKEFIQTRQRCNERTDNIEFEKMVEFMAQQTRALKERYQFKAVQFQVVEEGGKTKLKVIPVK